MIAEHSGSLFHETASNGVGCRNESVAPNFQTVLQIFGVFDALRSGPLTEVSLMVFRPWRRKSGRDSAQAVCVALSSGVVGRGCFISTVRSQSITETAAVCCESPSLLQLNEKITPISHISEAY